MQALNAKQQKSFRDYSIITMLVSVIDCLFSGIPLWIITFIEYHEHDGYDDPQWVVQFQIAKLVCGTILLVSAAWEIGILIYIVFLEEGLKLTSPDNISQKQTLLSQVDRMEESTNESKSRQPPAPKNQITNNENRFNFVFSCSFFIFTCILNILCLLSWQGWDIIQQDEELKDSLIIMTVATLSDFAYIILVLSGINRFRKYPILFKLLFFSLALGILLRFVGFTIFMYNFEIMWNITIAVRVAIVTLILWITSIVVIFCCCPLCFLGFYFKQM